MSTYVPQSIEDCCSDLFSCRQYATPAVSFSLRWSPKIKKGKENVMFRHLALQRGGACDGSCGPDPSDRKSLAPRRIPLSLDAVTCLGGGGGGGGILSERMPTPKLEPSTVRPTNSLFHLSSRPPAPDPSTLWCSHNYSFMWTTVTGPKKRKCSRDTPKRKERDEQ